MGNLVKKLVNNNNSTIFSEDDIEKLFHLINEKKFKGCEYNKFTGIILNNGRIEDSEQKSAEKQYVKISIDAFLSFLDENFNLELNNLQKDNPDKHYYELLCLLFYEKICNYYGKEMDLTSEKSIKKYLYDSFIKAKIEKSINSETGKIDRRIYHDFPNFLSKKSQHRVDLIGCLDKYFNILGNAKEDLSIDEFYKNYCSFYGTISDRPCPFYVKDVDQLVELYCLFYHRTSNDFTKIKNNLLSYQKEIDNNYQLNNELLKDTRGIEIEVFELIGNSDNSKPEDFECVMKNYIQNNPLIFSRQRHRSLIFKLLEYIEHMANISACDDDSKQYFKCLRKRVEFDENISIKKPVGNEPFFTIREIKKLLEIVFKMGEISNKSFDRFLSFACPFLVRKVDVVHIHNLSIKKNNLSSETELFLLRSIIILLHFMQEDKKDNIIENTNNDLVTLGLCKLIFKKDKGYYSYIRNHAMECVLAEQVLMR